MCELLIRVTDQSHSNPYVDAALIKRGMVVVAMPDGWGWSLMEKTNSDWRILRCVHETEESVQNLLEAQTHTHDEFGNLIGFVPNPMLRPRAVMLDLDQENIPNDLQEYLNDATRTNYAFDIPKDFPLITWKMRTSILKNPREIG